MKRVRGLAIVVTLALGAAVPGAMVPGAQVPGAAVTEIRVGILKPGGGYTTTVMPLDTYVARVLAGEAARDSQPAALEALAIAIRTFALANRGRHRADGFDLCDQTHCQVVRTATAATDRAARASSGRILVHDGVPAAIYYTASCGGRTEIPSHVWPGADDPSFLPSQADDACEGAPAWSVEIESRDLARALRSSGFSGDRVRDLRVGTRNGSGRVAVLKIDGFTPDEISGQDLRVAVGRTLGWTLIKSTAFELQRRGDVYRFTGHGYGHGVGMCVIGSARLAERGATAEAILARYFPGLPISGVAAAPTLTASRGTPPPARSSAPAARPAPAAAPRAPAPAVAISLPDEDEGERVLVMREALRARDDVARALGVSPPGSVTLRFHPTTDDYERVTARPWFTSAAVVRGELHLLPIATLRQRGLLDVAIRHELVHVMADAALVGRPAWVREGAAAYFAGGKTVSVAVQQRPAFRPAPKSSCPSDAELLQPVSAGALANAYARARACFEGEIRKGKSWRDVR